ncbi:hybrid sensor histidine kinase/response regulator [Dyadobacter helix]|nr:ATP-binding protein [Dyadobacter sp. CECT 9275]
MPNPPLNNQVANQETNSAQNLIELTAHLQSLIASLDDIVFEIDGTHSFKNVWVDDETKLFMPKNDFLGKKIRDVAGPLADLVTGLINKAIETGEMTEIVYKHFDSSIDQWFRARIKPVIKAPDPKEYVLVLSIQDVTRQRHAELILQETKESLELSNQLLDVSQKLSQTVGWEYNMLTGEIFWTKQVYLLFDEQEGFQPTLDNLRPLIEPDGWNLMKEAIDQKHGYDIEIRVQTSRGAKKWVRAIGEPVLRRGELVTMRGALMDITLNKENEIKIIEAKNAAEGASKAKSDFLSIMSHEIRTPLNGIIGIANLLKLNHTVDQNEYVSNLIFCADHLLELINDILDLNKMENDKLELIVAEVNLAQLIRNIKNQFKSLAEAKGIRIVSLIDDDIPTNIIADPIRLGQILNNLVSNAIKFTEKGEVALIVKLVALKYKKATINFKVKDTGMGIPEELHETIFESFKQVQQSAYRKHSGTGLGLAITQKLAALHHSRIALHSEPGVGTEFYFDITFDIAENQKKLSSLSISPVMASFENKLNGLRILLVEDNPINVLVARKQLEYFGVSLDYAYSGKEGLALLEQNQYHVALLDLHIPEIDGYALAEIIRKKYSDVHIIIFTADIMQDVKIRLSKMQVYDILSKPFAPDKMFEMLLKVAKARNLTA